MVVLKRTAMVWVCVIFSLWAAVPAAATVIPISIPGSSFEAPATSTDSNCEIPGWNENYKTSRAAGNYGAGVEATLNTAAGESGIAPADGSQCAFLWGTSGTMMGSIWQDTSLATNCAAGYSYTLTVGVGVDTKFGDGTLPSGTDQMAIKLYYGTLGGTCRHVTWLPDYDLVSATIAVSDVYAASKPNGSTPGHLTNYTITTPTIASGDPAVGQPLGIWIGCTSVNGSYNKVNWIVDNVLLSGAQVPEPSTLVTFSLGLAGMAIYAWRRSKQTS